MQTSSISIAEDEMLLVYGSKAANSHILRSF